jgi:hypothetical protein
MLKIFVFKLRNFRKIVHELFLTEFQHLVTGQVWRAVESISTLSTTITPSLH